MEVRVTKGHLKVTQGVGASHCVLLSYVGSTRGFGRQVCCEASQTHQFLVVTQPDDIFSGGQLLVFSRSLGRADNRFDLRYFRRRPEVFPVPTPAGFAVSVWVEPLAKYAWILDSFGYCMPGSLTYLSVIWRCELATNRMERVYLHDRENEVLRELVSGERSPVDPNVRVLCVTGFVRLTVSPLKRFIEVKG